VKKFSVLLFLPLFQMLFSACAMMRAPSLNMLNQESDYDGHGRLKQTVSSLDRPLLVPSRTNPKVTDIWIHPHEMPTGDYFRGGWIRTIVTDSRWEIEAPKQSAPVQKPQNKIRK
jgi:hypothetical protein